MECTTGMAAVHVPLEAKKAEVEKAETESFYAVRTCRNDKRSGQRTPGRTPG